MIPATWVCRREHKANWYYNNTRGDKRCRLCEAIQNRNQYRVRKAREIIYTITDIQGLRKLARDAWRYAEQLGKKKSDIEVFDVPANDIMAIAANYYDVAPERLRIKDNTKLVSSARHLAAYLLYDCTSRSTTRVGNVLDRDHATIINSVARVRARMLNDPRFREDVAHLMENVRKLKDEGILTTIKAQTYIIRVRGKEVKETDGHCESQI